MRGGLTVLLITLVLSSGAAQEAEWYQGKPIRNIIFKGLKNVKQSELEGVVNPYIGRLFTDELFWELTGKLYALEYFEVINPNAAPVDALGKEVVIQFTVTERPVASRITFQGNSKLKRAELLETISLKPDMVVNQLKLRLDEQALINKYREKGYPDVKVSAEIQTNPKAPAAVTVIFVIVEGDQITIDGFRFEGNNVFSDRALRSQLSLKAKNLFNDGAFQEAKLLTDRNAITQYYHDRGYIDAEVVDVVRELKRDNLGGNNLTLIFRIYEGRSYTFGGVGFEGNQLFTDKQLADLIRSRKGETVNARRLEADLQRVSDLYYENGYIFNTINREENRNTDTGVIAYTIQITERGRVHIESISIKGNSKTKDHVILREIALEPGDVFSKTKITDGVRNLLNLQFFSTVAPDMSPGSADNLMDLVISVEEQPTTDIQFGLTFSGTSDPNTLPVSLLLKYNDRNFLGRGNMISAEGNMATDAQSVTLSYTHRWILGLPLSGSVDLTYYHSRRRAFMDNLAPFFNGDEEYAYPDGFNSYDDYVDASKSPPREYLMYYDQHSISLGFSTGYRWSTALGNVGLGGGFRVGWILNYYDEQIARPFDPVLRDRNQQFIPALSLSSSLSLDQRDIYYDPSKGYYGIQRIGFYGLLPAPIEREHYMKSETKAEHFITLFNLPVMDSWSFKAVLGLHTGLSFIFPQSPGRPLEIEQANMLAVDGMFIGRGWMEKRTDRGLALWENWAELRFPLLPGMLAFDMFFDAAASKSTPEALFKDFKSLDMVYSFGGGFRFSIPQFPFRFLFTKGFTVGDSGLVWKKGVIFANDSPNSGIDFVISFAISTY
ncbi:MAG: outer membrane protein assembly factor BamA [Treponema sp.]|nr:outer membrane protein assembly factor BamA [Treponema sp.]